MSLYSTTNYYSELEKIIHYGRSKKETAIRHALYNLLNDYARNKDLKINKLVYQLYNLTEEEIKIVEGTNL